MKSAQNRKRPIQEEAQKSKFYNSQSYKQLAQFFNFLVQIVNVSLKSESIKVQIK